MTNDAESGTRAKADLEFGILLGLVLGSVMGAFVVSVMWWAS